MKTRRRAKSLQEYLTEIDIDFPKLGISPQPRSVLGPMPEPVKELNSESVYSPKRHTISSEQYKNQQRDTKEDALLNTQTKYLPEYIEESIYEPLPLQPVLEESIENRDSKFRIGRLKKPTYKSDLFEHEEQKATFSTPQTDLENSIRESDSEYLSGSDQDIRKTRSEKSTPKLGPHIKNPLFIDKLEPLKEYEKCSLETLSSLPQNASEILRNEDENEKLKQKVKQKVTRYDISI